MNLKFQVQVKSSLIIISFKFSSLKIEELENFKWSQVWKLENLTWLEIYYWNNKNNKNMTRFVYDFWKSEERFTEWKNQIGMEKRWAAIFYQISTKKGPNFIENLCDSYAQCGIQSDIPLLLRKSFNALKCISPTSIESERAFSITGQLATKLQTKLDDDTFSSLVFLQAFYKKMRPQTK